MAEGVQRGPAPRGFGPRSSSPISGWNFEEPEAHRSSRVAELVDRKRGEEPSGLDLSHLLCHGMNERGQCLPEPSGLLVRVLAEGGFATACQLPGPLLAQDGSELIKSSKVCQTACSVCAFHSLYLLSDISKGSSLTI